MELFPREKLGLFCSAQDFFCQTIVMVLSPCVISLFFDWLKFNRDDYIWAALFYFFASLVTVKVYFNWKRKMEAETPSPADAAPTLGA